jgi:AraC-like DNA-binding protein
MTIAATILRVLIEALEEMGIDWRVVLIGCEINPEQLEDPDARVSQESFEQIWITLQELTGDPCIGLHAGERVHTHAVNLFGYLMMSSATLGAGVRRVARYQQVLAGVPWIEMDEDTTSARFRIGAAARSDDVRAMHAEYMAALLPRMMGWVSDGEVVPEGVSFRHDARGPLDDYTRVLRCDVEFGARHSELVFSAATLARPSQHAEESLARLHEDFAERLLARRDEEDDVTYRVRRLLAECLESGEADLRFVARQLGMSARSLQRQLAGEGTTFSGLLDGLRREVAREHLECCRTPIAGVAHLAGFSDVSAFTRAASRWFGATPARLRQLAGRR